MAIKFNDVKGEAKKSNYYKFTDGVNKVRLVGDVLPRYVYWVEKQPIECLGFDRDKETFTNLEKDWVQHFDPSLKCGWSYVTQCIDLETGELKTLALKKMLFQEILAMANKHLGDPTDLKTGWDVVIERVKTGSAAFNVKYSLDQMSCKTRELTAEELDVVKDLPSIEDEFPRPTPEEQKAQLEKIFGTEEEKQEERDEAIKEEIADFNDDIPF